MTGRCFEFPDGSLYDVIVPGATTGGVRSEVEVTLPPSPAPPPPHIHPHQLETLAVLDGVLEALVGQEWQELTAGQTLQVPKGAVHTFRNRSGENVKFRCVHEPASDFEHYLERLYWLSAMNRISGRRNLTSALYASLLFDTHRRNQVLAGRGVRIGTRALAGVARLLGMRVDR